eukprot:TRINITY_DN10605_c0_g1_i1.p1 TRINITY_DN10605_c0_g1~~TRINITY_DN10605_c0_g1_i1.p1  ORF type:complete len:160 (-),score=24.76 TRINITY_DN10605_c0_g1_i1:10-489(-)
MSLKHTILGIENELWVSLSTSTATSQYTRHDPSKIDTTRVEPYLRDDATMILHTFQPFIGKKAILEGCAKMKPYTNFKIDEGTVEVRALAGEPGGNEQAAVITYKVSESTNEGTTETMRMSAYGKGKDGKWYNVSHMCYLTTDVSAGKVRDIHFKTHDI